MTRQPLTESKVANAARALAAGGLVVVLDDEDRENEADLVGAAELMTEEQMAFMIRYTAGVICAPALASRCEALRLPPMVSVNKDRHATAFTVSVDHMATTTGISAADRVRTVRALAQPTTQPDAFRRPGHIFPLQAADGGVLSRAGHTEATVDLLQIARLEPVGVISELISDDGTMMRGKAALAFAADHDLPTVTVAEIAEYRWRADRLVEPVASSRLPTALGEFRAVAYRSLVDSTEHLALVLGDVAAVEHQQGGVLTRVHSECLTGDVFGSLRCDCGTQLESALERIAQEGCGVLIYLRGHEGRGIGLGQKLMAYALQDQGLDTVDANLALGLPVDARTYGVGAQILTDLGVTRIRLLTNSTAKTSELSEHGVVIVERLALDTPANEHNIRYLRTKRDRLGHELQVRVAPGGS